MEKTTVIAVAITIGGLLLAPWTQAGVSLVMNGSFENDGPVEDIITEKAPQHWCDVNVPEGKFLGWVDTDWSTHGYGGGDFHCLTLYSQGTGTFEAGDMATVSQQVYLMDVNQLIFDIKLDTDWSGIDWDPQKRSALLLIDDKVAWDSNTLEPNESGEYRNVEVDININDPNLHTLSLAIKANVADQTPYIAYLAQWDFVKFDTHCGGFGYLLEDLNQDCYVDMNDLAIFAEQWLAQVEYPNDEYDLFQDDEDIVNLRDLAVLADNWMHYRDWANWQDPNFLILELLDADLNNDGLVNLCDFAILTGDWASEDDCIRANIDRSGAVDYNDLSIMTDEWLLRSWLYDLE